MNRIRGLTKFQAKKLIKCMLANKAKYNRLNSLSDNCDYNFVIDKNSLNNKNYCVRFVFNG